jgi:hypothetical protein
VVSDETLIADHPAVSITPLRDQPTEVPEVSKEETTGTHEYAEWNTLCIAAFVVCMLGLTALFQGAGILSYLVLLAIPLGIAGVIQADVREQRGAGFGVAAFVTPVVLFLLVLALLQSPGGWGH